MRLSQTVSPPLGLSILGSAASRRVLTSEARLQIIAYLADQRNADGGFRGRSLTGESDLYYSFFGLAGLIVLGAGRRETAPAARWLESIPFDQPGLDAIHRICLARGKGMARRRAALAFLVKCGALEWIRRPVGNVLFRRIQSWKSPFSQAEKEMLVTHLNGGESSGNLPELYLVFLRYQLWEDMALRFPPDDVRAALEACKCPDGGFGSAPGMKEGVTSATAAGLVLQAGIGEKPSPRSIDWLLDRQDEEGGFAGTPESPIGDLLSTAVALFALDYLRHPFEKEARERCEEFVAAHWNEDGGFCGTVLDPDSDVEYTFYGILALGCLKRLKQMKVS